MSAKYFFLSLLKRQLDCCSPHPVQQNWLQRSICCLQGMGSTRCSGAQVIGCGNAWSAICRDMLGSCQGLHVIGYKPLLPFFELSCLQMTRCSIYANFSKHFWRRDIGLELLGSSPQKLKSQILISLNFFGTGFWNLFYSLGNAIFPYLFVIFVALFWSLYIQRNNHLLQSLQAGFRKKRPSPDSQTRGDFCLYSQS